LFIAPALDALDANTLAVRHCQCLPPYQTVDAAFTAVAALAHPEVRAGNPSRSLARVMRRWRQKITFSRRIRVSEEVKGVITGGLLVVSDHRIDTGSKSFHGEGLDH
jgi:hypothetical protein